MEDRSKLSRLVPFYYVTQPLQLHLTIEHISVFISSHCITCALLLHTIVGIFRGVCEFKPQTKSLLLKMPKTLGKFNANTILQATSLHITHATITWLHHPLQQFIIVHFSTCESQGVTNARIGGTGKALGVAKKVLPLIEKRF